MEALKEVWEFVSTDLGKHWIGIMFVLIVSIVAQTLKTKILTVDMAKKSKAVFWLRRTFPLALLALGLIVGIVMPGEVAPGVDTVGDKILYFMGCSGVAMVGFNVFKQWVKKKYDVDILFSDVEKT
jgi:hypothetical protein